MNTYTKEDLKKAVVQGDSERTKKLLKCGISPNVTDEKGVHCLHLAWRRDLTEIADLSFQYETNAGGREIGEKESLLSIVLNNNPLRKSHLEIIKLLIQYGVTPDTAEDVDIGWSLRNYLLEDDNAPSSKESEPSLSELIEENIYADDPKLNDEELLELLELLLQCGFGKNTDLLDLFVNGLFFDTNSINYGCEPRCTSILLKHGVTPNMTDENGTTAFMHSAQFPFSGEIADLLLEKEPNLLPKDKNDKTTLMYASEGTNM